MKQSIKVVAAALAATFIFGCMVMFFASCGNMQLIDTTFKYDYAIISLPNGEIVEGKVLSWGDYDGEQLQIKINGKMYLVNSVNVALIAE